MKTLIITLILVLTGTSGVEISMRNLREAMENHACHVEGSNGTCKVKCGSFTANCENVYDNTADKPVTSCSNESGSAIIPGHHCPK